MKPLKSSVSSPLILLSSLVIILSPKSMAENELMAVDRAFNSIAREDGSVINNSGKYPTVSRKNAHGKWKSVVDMGANYPTDANQ